MKLGSRFNRCVALIIDCLILYLVQIAMLYFFNLNSSIQKIVARLIALGVNGIYFVVFEQSKYQATPGKMLLRLYVADMNGHRISLSRAFKRYIWQFAPYLFCLILALILFVIGFLVPSSYRDVMASVLICSVLIVFGVLNFMMYLPILFKPRRGVYEELSDTVVLSR